MKFAHIFLLLQIAAAECAMAIKHDVVEVVVTNTVVGQIDARIFGQFLERSSQGEPGPEAFASPETGCLPPAIVERLQSMRIPVIRFPGGTDVDRIDWRDMVDNVPDRTGNRPVTITEGGSIANRFGYDEYFRLREELGAETIIVLNFMDAVFRRKKLEEAVRDSVGLLAYCNAKSGQPLPEGMPNWPAVRARNGHSEPYRCEYVQIGNEWMFKIKKMTEATGVKAGEELANWIVVVLQAYIRAIRSVDPNVKIIIDGGMPNDMDRVILSDEVVRHETYAVTFHVYAPGPIGPVLRNGVAVPAESLTTTDWWYGCCAIPGKINQSGNIDSLSGSSYELAKKLGYRIAITEWNWNGWAMGSTSTVERNFRQRFLPVAKTLGVAGFLHGMMRDSQHIRLATQSMLLGHRWDIAAIRADPAGLRPPTFGPQGLVTAAYRRNHGERLLQVICKGVPKRSQPIVLGKWTKWTDEPPELSLLDVIASASTNAVFVHVIQRDQENEIPLRINVAAIGVVDAMATRHQIQPTVADSPASNVLPHVVAESVLVQRSEITTTLPPGSVTIFEVPLPARPEPSSRK